MNIPYWDIITNFPDFVKDFCGNTFDATVPPVLLLKNLIGLIKICNQIARFFNGNLRFIMVNYIRMLFYLMNMCGVENE